VSSRLERRPASPWISTAISPAARPSESRLAKSAASAAPANGRDSADSSGAAAAGRLAASKTPLVYPLATDLNPVRR